MNNKKPNIICMGILDIKGDEIKFLAEEVERAGGNPIIMEISLGHEVGWADIGLSEVLAESGLKKEEVFKSSRSDAISLVGTAGAMKIKKLYDENKIDGVISWAGSVGTSTATMVMRALPIGFPKIMLSTLASGDVSSWLGNKDIYIVNPISEKGVNKVTRKLIGNAARNFNAAIRQSAFFLLGLCGRVERNAIIPKRDDNLLIREPDSNIKPRVFILGLSMDGRVHGHFFNGHSDPI